MSWKNLFVKNAPKAKTGTTTTTGFGSGLVGDNAPSVNTPALPADVSDMPGGFASTDEPVTTPEVDDTVDDVLSRFDADGFDITEFLGFVKAQAKKEPNGDLASFVDNAVMSANVQGVSAAELNSQVTALLDALSKELLNTADKVLTEGESKVNEAEEVLEQAQIEVETLLNHRERVNKELNEIRGSIPGLQEKAREAQIQAATKHTAVLSNADQALQLFRDIASLLRANV